MEKLGLSENYYKNVLVLAYLGDSVFTLMVRRYLVKNHSLKARELNKIANNVVCAKTQAELMNSLRDSLNEDELDIVMRARNSHINSKAKHSTLKEYSLATQFEALLGYWYLNGNITKLDQMFDKYVKERL